jgi:hypothetical protein
MRGASSQEQSRRKQGGAHDTKRNHGDCEYAIVGHTQSMALMDARRHSVVHLGAST